MSNKTQSIIMMIILLFLATLPIFVGATLLFLDYSYIITDKNGHSVPLNNSHINSGLGLIKYGACLLIVLCIYIVIKKRSDDELLRIRSQTAQQGDRPEPVSGHNQ